ncbi:hypothetical protein L1077_04935 [Pseudoalteromonas luteoviolacea]|uniref:hypothetical protein n=1 Tax=Pseudoalteromonas luteoviolacea TaxID=43657 RepID=UPI001F217E28|nr:hypothetical protein [Pseudoalteromonas luteoviolacea]MCF6438775.1 hypothetical protein [Pseudoalteromonas luteoviolacea]
MKRLLFITTMVSSACSFSANAAMDIWTFQHRASIDAQMQGRCIYQTPVYNYTARNYWAYENRLITARAAEWGNTFGFYPVIDIFTGEISAVCSAGRS